MQMKNVLSGLLLAALIGPATTQFWRKYILVNKLLPWTDAQAYCRENFVDLLTIQTQEDLQRLQNNGITCPNGCWTGLTRNLNTMTFTQWSDGSPLGATRWWTDEPSNKTNLNCVNTFSYWHSDDCKRPLIFVCYIWVPQLIVVQLKKTWEEALKYCRTNYTDLVNVITAEDHFVVNSKSREILTPSFWTGLRFLYGSWFWVNQTTKSVPPARNLTFMASCPAPNFRCGAQNVESNVLENTDCEVKMNFMCYNQTIQDQDKMKKK